MATNSTNRELQKLQAENKRLREDNAVLRKKLTSDSQPDKHRVSNLFRNLGVILFIGLAVAFLAVGNIFFWAGHTLTNTDDYVAATAPIIQNTEVQKAIATKTTEKLFASVDVNQLIEDTFPPRLDFLAPTLAAQAQSQTQTLLEKVMARPDFQTTWNEAQARAHERFITRIQEHGSDGVIDISEVYADASQRLRDTKLAFLADKPLPAKIGQIKIASGSGISALQNMIENIDMWRVVALIMLCIFSALAVWLSRNRRKAVIVLGAFFAASMFLTAVAGRLTREVLADKADPRFAEATRQAYTIFMHPLFVQTFTILTFGILIMFIAWISGPYASSQKLRLRINELLSGKIHASLFGQKENGFTLWFGKYKRVLEWLTVIVLAAVVLFTRLTPTILLMQIVLLALIVGAIEIFAADRTKIS